jgi:hypothetical protein
MELIGRREHPLQIIIGGPYAGQQKPRMGTEGPVFSLLLQRLVMAIA